MEGYIKNTGNRYVYIFKQPVKPGERIELDSLYRRYGKKHGIEEGDAFVDWVKNVKLRDNTSFTVFYKGNMDKAKVEHTETVQKSIDSENRPSVAETNEKSKINKKDRFNAAVKGNTGTAPVVKTKMNVEDVVSMSVRTARVKLNDITDYKLLKYAYQEARNRTGKDTLCQLLRRRLKDMEMDR